MTPGASGYADEQGAIQLPKPAAWEEYFPETEYTATDRRAMLLHQLLPFLSSSAGWGMLSKCKAWGDGYVVPVDLQELQTGSHSEDLMAAIEIQPLEGMASISAAIHEAIFHRRADRLAELLGERAAAGPVKARLFNFKESLTVIRLLKSSAIGRLVTIRGTVVRASTIKPLVTDLDFACSKCGEMVSQRLEDGIYQPPASCQGGGCRSRTFIPQRKSAKTMDWQKLRLQELSGADKDDAGGVPRTLEVELKGDLVDCCSAGGVVTVLGLVKVATSEARKGSKQNENCLFLLYLEAVSVVTSRGTAATPAQPANTAWEVEKETAPPNMDALTFKDLQFVTKFTEEFEGDQFRHLVHALCPAIYGHELIKAGILLSLFGGVRKHVGSANRVPTRGDIHVLICGDPGLGKSQMLQAAAAVAPRGVYICGNTSSSAGLTATVVRDPLTGAYMCEAGALVLADRGVCCIDEFDKMGSEHQALLGALEQQEVTAAKAGVCTSLPARTAVIAAANPCGGQYTRAKTISENVKLSSAMLSRFDVTFLLLDRPDEALDGHLSEHILAMHAGGAARAHVAKKRLLEYRSAPAGLLTNGEGEGRVGLLERLKRCTEADADLMPPSLIRKYIAYARTYVHPTLSPGAKQVLKAFYLELRGKAMATEGAPITTRQLESLVRLAEARARVDLREEASEEDAVEVVELMRHTLLDEFLDGEGVLDFRRAGGKSKQNEAKRFLAALSKRAELRGSEEFTMAELFDMADTLELAVPDVSDFISQLNEAGELLKKGGQKYALRCKVGSACSQMSSGNSGSTRMTPHSQY